MRHQKNTPSTGSRWIEGWSWGACLMAPVWAVRFRVWIGLAALIPVIGWFTIPFYMGKRGRRFAWNAAKNQSQSALDAIHASDKRFTHWGIIFLIALCLSEAALIVYLRIETLQHKSQHPLGALHQQTSSATAQEYAYFSSYLALKQSAKAMIEHLREEGVKGKANCSSAADLAQQHWAVATAAGDKAISAIRREENAMESLAAQEVSLRDVIRFGEQQDCY